jgi:hypothetical protein
VREFVCSQCGVGLRPTALFLSHGCSYWTASPEDRGRYEVHCQAKDHDLGPEILGCRFMRQTLDPWFAPDCPDAPRQDWAPGQPITVQSVAELIALGLGSAKRHGIAETRLLAGAGEYTRRPPDLFDWTDVATRRPVDVRTVFRRVERYEPIHHLTLKNAVVVDQGAVITSGGSLLHDSILELLVHGHTPVGLAPTSEGQYQWTGAVNRRIDVPTLLLKRPWWRNYGHFLVDAAALLALLREHRIGGFQQVAIGAFPEPGLREIVREALSIIAPGLPVVEHPDDEIWQFSELRYTQPVQIPALFKLPDALAALRRALVDTAPQARGYRRLFVSRRNYRSRRLENEAAVVEVCARHGFETICPETLSLREQARLFATASHVVGVKGAALTNLLFCPPGAAVVLLSPADWVDLFFWDLAGQRGFAYYELTGVLAREDGDRGQNPFMIDPVRLDALLRGILPATAPPLPDGNRRSSAPPLVQLGTSWEHAVSVGGRPGPG